jgi:hypothetical protein
LDCRVSSVAPECVRQNRCKGRCAAPGEKVECRSSARRQHLPDRVAIDIVCFQVFNGAHRVEFGLYIEAMANDFF